MIEGPFSDHAYRLTKAYKDLAPNQTYASRQLRENPELARHLASMLSGALQAVHDVVEDDKLWKALGTAGQELDAGRIENLIGFAQQSLEPLLQAFGYKPPPPVYELVDKTEAALIVVGEAVRRRTIGGDELEDARYHLRFLLNTVEERLDPRFAPRQAAPVMLAAASELLRVLVRIIPPVVGAAVAGAIGLPPELGAAAGEGAKELVKQAGEMAAGALIGFGIDHARKDRTKFPELSDRAARYTQLWMSIETLASVAQKWARERKSLEEFTWICQHADETWQKTYGTAAEVAVNMLKDYILDLDSNDLDEKQRRFISLMQTALSRVGVIKTPADALEQLGPALEGIREFTRGQWT